MNIDELVEAEFEAQLAQGLMPAPMPRLVEFSFQVEVQGQAVTRTRTVPEPEVEKTIDRLLDRGAFDFSV